MFKCEVLQLFSSGEKNHFVRSGFLNVAPFAGLEPATYGLTVRRSTN